jgi:hypothetical protein
MTLNRIQTQDPGREAGGRVRAAACIHRKDSAENSGKLSRRLPALRSGEMSGTEIVRSAHRPLQSLGQVIELEPLALAPLSAARFLSISKRSLSRLIAEGKVVARKEGTRTLVDVESLKSYYASLPMKQ